MNHLPVNADQSVASVACTACHRKKRKCDRRKPSCSRCLKVQHPCLYDDLHSMFAGGVFVSSTPHSEVENLETTSTSEILKTLNNQSSSSVDLIEKYNQIIHPWLPIIDVRRIKDRLGHRYMLEVADAELASLLLCIHIATQPSSTRMQNSEASQKVYTQAQKAFASSQILNKFAIGTIQCGLLLTVYQLGAGLFLEAYVTLSTTTGLARVNRLKQYRQKKEHDNEAEVVWWAIFLLDRILALASLPNNLPLLVEQPRSVRDLTADLPFRVDTQNRSGAEARCYELFHDEIRSAYLVGQILDYLNNDCKYHESQFEEMNGQLAALLSVLFERASGSWRPLCGSIAMLLISAIELQFGRLIKPESGKQSHVWHTLTKFLEITLDIAEDYIMDQNRNSTTDVAPIASVISNYRASLAILRQNTLGHAVESQYPRGLMVLKEALQLNGRWWGLADQYRNSLTQSTT